MEVINVTIFVVFLFSIMAVMANLKKNRKPNLLFVVIVIIILSLVSGLRTVMGDTGAYKYSYELVGQGFEQTEYEKGWIDYYKFLNSISKDPQFMLLVTAFIVTTFTVLTLRDYSSLFELQSYLYITCGTYLVSMNGVRQCLAASILFWCVRFIIDGQFILYSIITLLMMRIHNSAFIMIPIYFIVRLEAWDKKTVKLMGIGFAIILLYGKLAPMIAEIMQGSEYSSYLENPEEGANFIRVIIASVPVILSYLYKDTIKKEWKESDIFINMSIINLMFMSLATYNWIFARFTLYFELYNVVLTPYIIKYIPNIKEKRLVYFCAIICYAIYFFIESKSCNYYTPYINVNMFFL